MNYIKITDQTFAGWLDMAKALWPDYEEEELRQTLMDIRSAATQETFLAMDGENTYAGFVNVSIRSDYVEGADFPTSGYIEGLYVQPEFRNGGIARKLVGLAEQWAFEQGCREMGSDTWEGNTASREFHKKLGFREESILVHFIKQIDYSHKSG